MILIYVTISFLALSRPLTTGLAINIWDEQPHHEILSYASEIQAPIVIENNLDFKSAGFSGNGTLEDPYILDNVVINGTELKANTLITIKNTNAYFVIKNLNATGSSTAIFLDNVVHGTLENLKIYGSFGYGILIERSADITVSDSYLWEEKSQQDLGITTALRIASSTRIKVLNNFFYHNRGGLEFYASSNILVENNIFFLNYATVYSENLLDSQILNNSIINSSKFGIFFDSITENNTVKWNDFINNSMNYPPEEGKTYAAMDDNGDNLFDYNFWDTWTAPDDNNDGIVDVPLQISGLGNNSDSHPLTAKANKNHDVELKIEHLGGDRNIADNKCRDCADQDIISGWSWFSVLGTMLAVSAVVVIAFNKRLGKNRK